MTEKCPKCGKFMNAEGSCTSCSVPTPQFRFEVPAYSVGQQGGIRTWIKQVEVRLRLANVTTEKDKYEHLVAALSPDITEKTYDLIINEPATNQYTTLIHRIESEFEPSESDQIKRLLKGISRGDGKPSVFFFEGNA